jgi:pseudouridine-5'-phosphate glycosidase
LNLTSILDVRSEVAAALAARRPVVALESTLIAHGLPWPLNIETARAAEETIRREGVLPATIAVLEGRPTVGLDDAELEALGKRKDVLKASRRDLAVAIVRKQTAATTVAATMYLAWKAGIRVFATGGIGGAHRGDEFAWDISADLFELARTPVCVVCAGAKSILDLPRTLELLETLGVPVIGYGTDSFPAFFVRSSGLAVSGRADTPAEAADLVRAHRQLGGSGIILAQPLPAEAALSAVEMEQALTQVEGRAASAGIRGKALTPFLLAGLAEATQGKTLNINRQLIIANARLAALVANHLQGSG